jgi:hypothetical protein
MSPRLARVQFAPVTGRDLPYISRAAKFVKKQIQEILDKCG